MRWTRGHIDKVSRLTQQRITPNYYTDEAKLFYQSPQPVIWKEISLNHCPTVMKLAWKGKTTLIVNLSGVTAKWPGSSECGGWWAKHTSLALFSPTLPSLPPCPIPKFTEHSHVFLILTQDSQPGQLVITTYSCYQSYVINHWNKYMDQPSPISRSGKLNCLLRR